MRRFVFIISIFSKEKYFCYHAINKAKQYPREVTVFGP